MGALPSRVRQKCRSRLGCSPDRASSRVTQSQTTSTRGEREASLTRALPEALVVEPGLGARLHLVARLADQVHGGDARVPLQRRDALDGARHLVGQQEVHAAEARVLRLRGVVGAGDVLPVDDDAADVQPDHDVGAPRRATGAALRAVA